MVNKIFDSQILWIVLILGLITSCEQEDNLLGNNIVGGNASLFKKTYVDLIATTQGADTIRSDKRFQLNATIGAYDDPVFGMTKSSYYTQVRLRTTNPTFGENAVVDSVVLSIPVYAESDTISYDRSVYKKLYTLSNENNDCSISETRTQYLKQVRYKMDSLYGNRNSRMTLKVYRVTQNMGTIDSTYYSNKNFTTGELFGSKQIDDNVVRRTIVQYNDNGNNNDVRRDSVVISDDARPMINIKLDGMKSFVQNQVVNQQGSANLSDQISFISNVIQGIKLEVEENDGFIFNIDPTQLSLVAYISSKNPAFVDANNNGVHDQEENCTVQSVMPTVQQEFQFVIGTNPTVGNTSFYNVVQNAIESTNGSITNNTNGSVLYLKGMGGAKVKLALNPEQIEEVRNNVKNNGWVVNEAHIKVYPETNTQGSLTMPDYLYLYNYTQKSVLIDYGIANAPEDGNGFQGFPYSQIAPRYDASEGYYILRCTEFLKRIVEDNNPVDELMLELGTYIGYNSSETFYRPTGPFNSNRLYNPYRLAIVGPNPDGGNMSKKLQLEIYYSEKN